MILKFLDGIAWDALVFIAILGHLLLAPYTKVEESFNLQASHDILQHGSDLEQYDHKLFPGSVPRSFLGAFATSMLAYPAVAVGAPLLLRLYAVRAAVALLSVLGFARMRCIIAERWGKSEARCFAIITAVQFHLPFYMSRTLPNNFALILCFFAHAEFIGGSGYGCLAFLGAAAAIFRCELLALIAPLGLCLLFQKRVNFWVAALVTALAAGLAILLSVVVDSIMWGRLVWPEFEVLWLNTYENRSSEWGTSPPLWYFYSALPRALLGGLPLAFIGALLETRTRGPLIVALSFVALYSLLPHKELRFVFPALPLINAAAAAGAARCFRMKGSWFLISSFILFGLFCATLLVMAIMAAASAGNYPGGVAMVHLHESTVATSALSVHIGNLAAQSGVSRFLQGNPAWVYSKEEGLTAGDLAQRSFDRLLTEWPEVPGYVCQAVVSGYERIALRRRLWFPIEIVQKPMVFILAKSETGLTEPCGPASEQLG